MIENTSNILFEATEIQTDNFGEKMVIKQKRGRKPKKMNENVNNINDLNNVILEGSHKNDIDILEKNNDHEEITQENNEDKPVIKKRGRKPKGGKIVQQPSLLNDEKNIKPNVILHLKCWLKDLEINQIDSNIESFHFQKNDLSYELIEKPISNYYKEINNTYEINKPISFNDDEPLDKNDENNTCYISHKENDVREIWKKLKQLEQNLHTNNIDNKKSACFWCTCDFDNPPIYIPKHFIKNSYHVYGCFCSPECSVAYLMEENIDSSTKFERYYLINHIYSKIYDYTKNIKPAPNPYYMLDKYYGNLSIQEYRSLLKNERLFLIIDKPLTRILPEIHEDNEDFVINNKLIPSNNYQIRKKLQKKNQNKNNIINENFGIV